jgi:hypothetical protein
MRVLSNASTYPGILARLDPHFFLLFLDDADY